MLNSLHRGILLLAALGAAGGCASDESAEPRFLITSPSVTVNALEDVTYCYFFRTPNGKPMALRELTSHMSTFTADLALVFTDDDVQPPGTLAIDCGLVGSGQTAAVISYVSYRPNTTFRYPDDDGTGTPVGQVIAGNQAGYLLLHYQNATNQSVTVPGAELRAVGWANTDVTRAEPYATYNGNINIPAMSSATVADSCDVPADATFFAMTTYSRKQSVHTYIKDGASVIFEGANYRDPGRMDFAAPFVSFASGKLTYQCDYVNTTNSPIQDGNNAVLQEACMALTWFYPATKARFCLNNFLIPSDGIEGSEGIDGIEGN